MDPLQVAHHANQSMEHGTANFLHTIWSHRDKKGDYVRVLNVQSLIPGV